METLHNFKFHLQHFINWVRDQPLSKLINVHTLTCVLSSHGILLNNSETIMYRPTTSSKLNMCCFFHTPSLTSLTCYITDHLFIDIFCHRRVVVGRRFKFSKYRRLVVVGTWLIFSMCDCRGVVVRTWSRPILHLPVFFRSPLKLERSPISRAKLFQFGARVELPLLQPSAFMERALLGFGFWGSFGLPEDAGKCCLKFWHLESSFSRECKANSTKYLFPYILG